MLADRTGMDQLTIINQIENHDVENIFRAEDSYLESNIDEH